MNTRGQTSKVTNVCLRKRNFHKIIKSCRISHANMFIYSTPAQQNICSCTNEATQKQRAKYPKSMACLQQVSAHSGGVWLQQNSELWPCPFCPAPVIKSDDDLGLTCSLSAVVLP